MSEYRTNNPPIYLLGALLLVSLKRIWNWGIPSNMPKNVFFRILEIKEGIHNDTSISNVVVVNFEHKTFVPNAFSPNNDDINDAWYLNFFGVSSFECRVYAKSG